MCCFLLLLSCLLNWSCLFMENEPPLIGREKYAPWGVLVRKKRCKYLMRNLHFTHRPGVRMPAKQAWLEPRLGGRGLGFFVWMCLLPLSS